MNLRDKLKFWIALNNYVEMIVGPAVAPLSLPNAIANSLSYVKAYGGTEQRNLPAGYTQIEYIEGTGTQYLDTGIVPTLDAKVEVKFAPVSQSTTGYWGARRDPMRFGCVTFSNGTEFGVGMTYNSWPTNRTTISFDAIYDCIVANGYTSVNGTEYTETPTTQYAPPSSFRLGVFEASGNPNYPAKAKFYKCKLWENDTLVFDGVPAKNSNNVAGMYDFVSGTFFASATSDGFVAGPDAVPTPDAPMDIVCNNGVLKLNTSATGYSTQTGTPTPTDPIDIVNYKQGDLILRGIGDYKDTYDATTGTITRNVGVKVLDGTENWNLYSVAQGVLFRIQIADSVSYAKDVLGVLCNAYQVVAGGLRENGTLTGSTTNYDFLNDNYTTLDDWKAYLAAQYAAGTPVIVYYPLATPTTEHYVGVYADGLVETINAHGKNLFDIATATTIYRNGTVQETKTATGYTLTNSNSPSNFILVNFGTVEELEGKTFVMSTTNTAAGSYGFLYADADGTNRLGSSPRNPITVSSEVAEGRTNVALKFFADIADSSAVFTYNDVQVEEGSTATDYAPYYNGGTATCEDLLSVGTYTDVQEILSGDVTRKVGIKVFDGTEDIVYSYGVYGIIGIPYNQNAMVAGTNRYKGFCSHAKTYVNSVPPADRTFDKFLFFTNVDFVGFGSYEAPAEITDVASVKQWLAAQYAAGTPVIIVYPLATETTESVAGQPLNVTNGDNVIDITQASLTGLQLEAKYKKRL